jgi:Domain of unknown function (DUF4160)
MPTVFRTGPYRIYFWSNEGKDPPHVHVDRDEMSAKFWIKPVTLAYNLGFKARELRRVEQVVSDNQDQCLEAWREYFHT